MNTSTTIDDLSHDEIRDWLKRALNERETLPRLTPDESPHLGILRLEKTVKPATRDSLRDGSTQLVRQFCAEGVGETPYVRELLGLASAFGVPETVHMLAQLAGESPQFLELADEVRIAVLTALVDTSPPQPPEFWGIILKQDAEKYAALALSGVLATSPAQAIKMLPAMPDTERAGQAAALKLDLAWDDLRPSDRSQFIQDIQQVLPQCRSRFAGPVRSWTETKQLPHSATVNPTLRDALSACLGGDSAPRSRTPKLCQAA